MSDVQNVAEQGSVPEQVTTAVPASEVITPEQATDVNQETPVIKTFTQEDVDSIVSKRLAREQRKWEREQAARQAETQVRPPAQTAPVESQGDEQPDPYALAQQLVEQRDRQKYLAEINKAYADREEKAFEKYEDFEQVAYNDNVPISDTMAETIRASDVGPDVAYYLGSNPKEAERIYQLSPVMQAREIGKIEAKLADAPPVKKTTSAPAPITPVTARASGNPSYDTTDPRSIKTMSTSEWIEAERQRQIRKMQAQQRL